MIIRGIEGEVVKDMTFHFRPIEDFGGSTLSHVYIEGLVNK